MCATVPRSARRYRVALDLGPKIHGDKIWLDLVWEEIARFLLRLLISSYRTSQWDDDGEVGDCRGSPAGEAVFQHCHGWQYLLGERSYRNHRCAHGGCHQRTLPDIRARIWRRSCRWLRDTSR